MSTYAYVSPESTPTRKCKKNWIEKERERDWEVKGKGDTLIEMRLACVSLTEGPEAGSSYVHRHAYPVLRSWLIEPDNSRKEARSNLRQDISIRSKCD